MANRSRGGTRRQYVLEVDYKKDRQPVDDRVFNAYAEEAVELWGGQRDPNDELFYPFQRVRVKRFKPPAESTAQKLHDFYVVRAPGRKFVTIEKGFVSSIFSGAGFVSAGHAKSFYDTLPNAEAQGYEIDHVVMTTEVVYRPKEKKP